MASTVTSESRTERLLEPETIGASAVVYLIVTVLHRGMSFARAVFFASCLSPAELGLWDMAFGFALLMSPIVVLGLPASVIRYASHYEQKGQLAAFLGRILRVGVTAGLGLALIFGLADRLLASIIFGDPSRTELARLAALCLAGLVLFDVLQAVFHGLRLFRVVSLLHLMLNLLFAVLGGVLILGIAPIARTVTLAHVLSTVAVVAGCVFWLRKRLPGGDPAPMTESRRAFWRRMLTYSVWVWAIATLTNALFYVDRIMLIHWSGQDQAATLAQLGSYHVFRLVALLLATVGAVFNSVVVPHIGHYWEAGRRRHVRLLLGALVKGVAFALTAIGIVLLATHGMLLELIFAGKYTGSPGVTGAVLVATALMAVFGLIDPYVLCLEKPWLSAAAALGAVAANVALNAWLIPIYQLQGAATATALSVIVGVALLTVFTRMQGWRFGAGLIVLIALPTTLFFGAAPAAVALLIVGYLAYRRGWFLSVQERALIGEQWEKLMVRTGLGGTRP